MEASPRDGSAVAGGYVSFSAWLSIWFCVVICWTIGKIIRMTKCQSLAKVRQSEYCLLLDNVRHLVGQLSGVFCQVQPRCHFVACRHVKPCRLKGCLIRWASRCCRAAGWSNASSPGSTATAGCKGRGIDPVSKRLPLCRLCHAADPPTRSFGLRFESES
jgi:hypothetical protein